MTGKEKVFIDTAPFIYLLENHPDYYIPVSEYLAMCLGTRQANLLTSVIVTAEFRGLPKRIGNLTVLNNLTNLLHELKFQVLAGLSSSLRARYTFLKGINATQVAAIHTGCQEFYTNDKPLNNIQEIKVVMASKRTK